MQTFIDTFETIDWDKVTESIYKKDKSDVETALSKEGNLSLDDFQALISPAAKPFLEQMAIKSKALTKKRFGKTIQLYIPLYLSNECNNICTYCGFSFTNKLPRKTLNNDEIITEAKIIKSMGYEHVLLVTGEDNLHVGMPYLLNAIRILRPYFAQISIEIQPLDTAEYELMKEEGVHAVLVYQETYHKATYKNHHPKGKKSNFNYRLETPDRIGRAGLHKIGLGTLIGLEDWRTDSYFTAQHLRYMESVYWKSKYSLSFPRLRPFSGGIVPKMEMSDRELVQLICAYRLFSPETELSLSTREEPEFRNHLVELGITQLSAGSKTNPGGYAATQDTLEQFEISDERSPAQIADMLSKKGMDPVWKDWDAVMD